MVDNISQLEEGLYVDEQSQIVYLISPDESEGNLCIRGSGKPDIKISEMGEDKEFLGNLRRLQNIKEVGNLTEFYRAQLGTVQDYIRYEAEKLIKLDETIRSSPRL